MGSIIDDWDKGPALPEPTGGDLDTDLHDAFGSRETGEAPIFAMDRVDRQIARFPSMSLPPHCTPSPDLLHPMPTTAPLVTPPTITSTKPRLYILRSSSHAQSSVNAVPRSMHRILFHTTICQSHRLLLSSCIIVSSPRLCLQRAGSGSGCGCSQRVHCSRHLSGICHSL